MESNALRYFCVTFALNMSRACLFLIQEVLFIANVKAFHTKKCNETWRKSKSRLYSRTQEKKVQHSLLIQNNEAQLLVYLKVGAILLHVIVVIWVLVAFSGSGDGAFSAVAQCLTTNHLFLLRSSLD